MKREMVEYRRKREGKTDYRRRLRILAGSGPRVVIRRSLNHIGVQLVQYGPAGDTVLASAHSLQLKKLGWKFDCGNIPAAYLTGMLFGIRVRGKVQESYLDIGRTPSVRGSRVYACAKGVQDSGIQLRLGKEVIPSDERIAGTHIMQYAAALEQGKMPGQFSEYKKGKADIRSIAGEVQRIKQEMSNHGAG
ncbi:50S ribosomal protein L18 [Candidatus Woesearchaeota archaeon]|nr:50S ribosomal protein L18 [Candidatus Woesearchaeota archaeon]